MSVPGGMLYSLIKNSETIEAEISIDTETALAFMYEWLSVSAMEKINIHIGAVNYSQIAEYFNAAGIKTVSSKKTILLSKTTINKDETLIKDFSLHPHLAIPFAISCAANGIQADLKGLESLKNIISPFQRELYRFNINTDFCDGSKLKVYNNKMIRQKSKQVDVSTNDILSLSFIPLADKFGKLKIELQEDFFEKFEWLTPLLSQLKFKNE